MVSKERKINMMTSIPALCSPQIIQPQASGHIQSAEIYQSLLEGVEIRAVIFGPMFSGKTTELMRRMKRYQIANYRCLVIKYAKDIRYADKGIATHDRQILPAVTATSLYEMKETAEKFNIIGIDEGQFFPDIVQFCDEMANQGKIVIVAALDGTFQRKGFGEILNLVPLAENVIKLSAVCMTCSLDGHFTKRTTLDKSVEVIGGTEMYKAVCRNCFKSPLKNSSRHSPYKVSSKKPLDIQVLSKSSETPSVLRELQNFSNSTNRQLFISTRK